MKIFKNISKVCLFLILCLFLGSCKTTQQSTDTDFELRQSEELSPPKSRGVQTLTRNAEVTTYFATNRNYKQIGEDLEFGNELDSLVLGKCTVSIPKTHKLGELEKPRIWKLEFKENPEKHIVVLSKKLIQQPDYFVEIENSYPKKALIFIPGFNASFEIVAKRTAQMAFDLNFKGVPIFYSWPSQGNITKYSEDEEKIAASEDEIEDFIKQTVKRLPNHEIFLIAHSMGNRALTNALVRMIETDPSYKDKFKEIILSAPDIDAEVFKNQIAPRIINYDNPITLYTSTSDIAMKISGKMTGIQKLGGINHNYINFEGIEPIDASNADTGFTGHQYFGDSNMVIKDIGLLINKGIRAINRETLEAEDQDGTYRLKLVN